MTTGLLDLLGIDVPLIQAPIRETRRVTSRPFGANLVLDFTIDDQLAVILEQGVRIVPPSGAIPPR